MTAGLFAFVIGTMLNLGPQRHELGMITAVAFL